ncbi:MAG: peptidoglycan editing factor PgeF [Deltaproteobacteria bacterium]|nr:MAG: peptidoglycan editing factor PgeF [Deltaproteobacteria bacterium]
MRRAKRPKVRILRSALLDRHGFRHGFSTRVGGVSIAPYDSLNLGFHLGDDEAAVRENRARFAASLGLGVDRLFEQRQVHGTGVRAVFTGDLAKSTADEQGDALVTRVEGIGIAARTADCVPVLLAHPPSGHVGAAHAGWRGAVAGVVPRAIDALSHDPAELVVAIGPHIRVDAFEIGEDVAREIEHAANGRAVVVRGGAEPHGDLAALIRFQLRDAGVPDDAIEDVGGCTWSDAAQFFSHRRDRGETGRHLSAIVARASR